MKQLISLKDGKYYYMGSQGDWTTYNVRVGVSDNLYGPYVNSQGQQLVVEGQGDSVVAHDVNAATCTGHNTVIRDDAGDYWILYHGVIANPATESERNLRTLMMDKLLWDKQTGMPYVEGRRASIDVREGPVLWEKE
jgi:arabinan endo-1,5-alpha-L-arabinosidase